MDLQERLSKFKEVEYELNKDYYLKIKDGQNPHTLFISCSDSRVDAETILQAKAGEIFQIRNVANIVPRKEEANNHPSVVSAVEYAVKVLNVDHIVVCGHSNCGGCKGMMDYQKTLKDLPYTGEWITQSVSISSYIMEAYPDRSEEEKAVMIEKLNAIQQLDNILTYKFIKEAYEKGDLDLKAYYYDIGTGIVKVYDYDSHYLDILHEIKKERAKYFDEKHIADPKDH